MKFLHTFVLTCFLLLIVGCGNGDNTNVATSGEKAAQTSASTAQDTAPVQQPIDVAGTTTADVSTREAFVAALAEAFISGDENQMAAVAFPNLEMMKAHILRHNGPANAKAAIDMLSTTMPMDLNRVLSGLKAARAAAEGVGADFLNANFDSFKLVSGLSIGGMKVNTLGMNIQSKGKVYAFELKECRDVLGRWITMGEAQFKGVSGGELEVQDDGTLDLGL